MIIPRPYQEEAIQAIYDYFKAGNRGNPLVVAPTGSGKTVMLAHLCSDIKRRWPNQKINILSHVKEILEQDYATLKKHLPRADLGLYSAGLKSRTIKDITVAGIQSVYNKPELFDSFNLSAVDEAHLIPPEKQGGRYHKFFKQVDHPVIGFTATPFRLGQGYLVDGKDAFFDDIVYEIYIRDLQKDGYLCNFSSKGTKERYDASKIRKQAGDYVLSELSLAFDRERITRKIVKELYQYKDLRKKWLLFAIDIKHAESIAEILNQIGIKSLAVHSKMKGKRDKAINEFKTGGVQALVSVETLTTGFDHPDADLIGLLRPTSSPVLHVQMIGRGARPVYADGYDLSTKEGRLEAISAGPKQDCLVLDFAGNLLRNGPIDAPYIKGKGEKGGEAIMKECPNCFEIVHAAVRVCSCCGHKFQFRHHLTSKPKNNNVMSQEEWHDVTEIRYERHVGSKKIPMLKVTYQCGLRWFSQYVCIEHMGYAQRMAWRWWGRRTSEPFPNNVYDALEKVKTLKEPVKILVEEGGKFPNIKEQEFKEGI